jgi:hypothetical protein
LFQYLDNDIPKTSNQAEHTFSLFQPIIDAGKEFLNWGWKLFQAIIAPTCNVTVTF